MTQGWYAHTQPVVWTSRDWSCYLHRNNKQTTGNCTHCTSREMKWNDGRWQVNTALFGVIQAATCTSRPQLAAVRLLFSSLLLTSGLLAAPVSAVSVLAVPTVRWSVSTDLYPYTGYRSALETHLKTNVYIFPYLLARLNFNLQKTTTSDFDKRTTLNELWGRHSLLHIFGHLD